MKKLWNSIAFKSIFGSVGLLIVFSVIVGIIGNIEFSDVLMNQYAGGAFYTADAAALKVKADHLKMYIDSGGTGEEFRDTQEELSRLCNSQGATFIYVIQPDLTDYGHITFIMVASNDQYSYPVYEFGYVRETTNDEYREKYRSLYEGASDRELVIRDKGYIETDPHITAMVPLKGLDNKTKAILCVQRQLDILADARFAYFKKIGQVMLLVALFVVLGQSIYVHRVLLEPLQIVINEAARFSNENVRVQKKLTEKIRNKDEIGDLARSIDEMEDQIAGYVNHLTNITAEEERIRTELSLGSRIQAAMLPSVFPAFPERREFDLFAMMKPAKEVGGDFYDFALIDSDHLYLVIADVSGKGIPAALFMMASRIILTQIVREGKSPAQALEGANDLICPDNKEEMFLTVWLGILEISTGRLVAANAGHEYPILRRPGGEFELFKEKHGFVIGGIEGVKYTEYQVHLKPGSKLFVYTDGIPEASNRAFLQFGTDRLLKALNEDPEASPEMLVKCVYRQARQFVGDAEQFDDMTMLCLEYNGREPQEPVFQNCLTDTVNGAGDGCSNMTDIEGSSKKTGSPGTEEEFVKELTLEATLEKIPEVTAFVNSLLDELGCSMKAQVQIDVAIDEIFSNIARYAYKGKKGSATVRIEKEKDPAAVLITFIDNGIPYNPLAQKDPDITLAAEERPIGGLGIFVVKKTMDDLQYAHRNGQNILRIRKRI